MFPKDYPLKHKHKVTIWMLRFTLKDEVLYHTGQDLVFQQCLDPKETLNVMEELHKGIGGGHFFVNITTQKILDEKH